MLVSVLHIVTRNNDGVHYYYPDGDPDDGYDWYCFVRI